MDTFPTMLNSITDALLSCTDTTLDYSLRDAEHVISQMTNPPTVTLTEIDRDVMRDILLTVTWDKHKVAVKLIASERYFTVLYAQLLINNKEIDWCWDSSRENFKCDSTVAHANSLWLFLTTITKIL